MRSAAASPASLVLLSLGAALALASPGRAATRQSARYEGGGAPPRSLSADCTLGAFNLCSGWIWVFDDVEGAVWGTLLDPQGCPGGCAAGGSVEEVTLYSRCSSVPGRLGSIGIAAVDAAGCRTALLYESGPVTIVHCVPYDRWQTISVPGVHLSGSRFAVTITWGPKDGALSNPQLATDNGRNNLFCKLFPWIPEPWDGCATSTATCAGWEIPPERSFVYVTDVNGDGVLDDLCKLYGAPRSVAFPYIYPYGYLPNNMLITVGMDCSSPTAVRPTSWGKVKALFE